MSKVEVLCPNGHRVTVKVTPNTKILQVLEEACTKKGFLPTSDYELKHGRRSLDVTLSVQFAALPNLAKLELVKLSKSRAETPVVIALQTADGQRMQSEFMPSLSLWDVLEHFDKSMAGGKKLTSSPVAGEHAVCIYMNEEVISEFALKQTTLRALGLTGGRVILRHLFRAVSDAAIAEIVDRVERENQRQSRLAAAAAAVVTATDSPSPVGGTSVETEAQSVGGGIPIETPPARSAVVSTVSEPFQPMEVDAPPNPEICPQPLAVARQADVMPHQFPRQPKAFAEFKFPEATKGQDLYRNELSEVNRDEFKPCDRETVVYSLDDIEPEIAQAAGEEIPDEFFEVTESDIRKMWQDMQRRTQEMLEQPLMTQTQRQRHLEAKMARYKRVVIRVQFPDRLVVQALFRTTEPVFNLYKFVKESLQDKNLPFELYTAPPKTVLKDNTQSMAEADLAPMSLVYFGSSVKLDHYLSDAILCSTDTQRAANMVVLKLNEEQSRPVSAATPQSNASTSRTSAGASGPSTKVPSGQTPKWFKSGHK